MAANNNKHNITIIKAMFTDPVIAIVVLVSNAVLLGGSIGVFLRNDSAKEKLVLGGALFLMYVIFLLTGYLRVLYIRWLLGYPCKIRALLEKEDKRYVEDGLTSNICYSFEYKGTKYTHYSPLFVSKGFREKLENCEHITIRFYPTLKWSLIEDAFF